MRGGVGEHSPVEQVEELDEDDERDAAPEVERRPDLRDQANLNSCCQKVLEQLAREAICSPSTEWRRCCT